MQKKELPAPTGHHNLILEDRSKLTLTGVTDVDCFDERMINLFTGLGELTIKGRNLHINDVSVETGDMTITGDIWLLQYGEKDRRGPLSLLGASSNFSSDETKSGVNTGCIHEHFCEI